MTNKQYSKEERFLRELAQVCQEYNTGIYYNDHNMAMVTTINGKLDIVDIRITCYGDYVGLTMGKTIKGRVE